MKKIKCIIVDDEPLAIQGIEIYIKDIDYMELVGTFNNALQLDAFLKENTVDLIFLDIEMPHLTGIDFLKTSEQKTLTILTTAYSEFALEAYSLNVVDYLLKPFRLERFVKAVNKARDIILQQNFIKDSEKDFIYVKSGREYIKVNYSDIEYISGLKDYTIIYSKGAKIIASLNIKTIYEQLPKDIFSRTSKSFIININYIKTINLNSIQLHSKEIPLGKGYKDDFFASHISDKIIKRNS
jgi:DNA-binding LytR/AlgR family response regulator